MTIFETLKQNCIGKTINKSNDFIEKTYEDYNLKFGVRSSDGEDFSLGIYSLTGYPAIWESLIIKDIVEEWFDEDECTKKKVFILIINKTYEEVDKGAK